MSNQCASCGKADANLKACKACKLVKYCGVDCQVAHRPAHKKACKKRAAELFDEKLFAQPPAREECPICMITLPCDDNEFMYMACCGKFICNGCRYCLTREHCPFCNTAHPRSDEVTIQMLTNRIEKYNDPAAMVLLAVYHIPVNRKKAFKLLQRACELGSAAGHYHLGCSYRLGDGTEIDKKRAIHHFQIAAIMGNMAARYILGSSEVENGNYNRAMRHFRLLRGAEIKIRWTMSSKVSK
eukprot:scaffold18734_cov38-Cyclotella_meneghiniana.AAC.2